MIDSAIIACCAPVALCASCALAGITAALACTTTPDYRAVYDVWAYGSFSACREVWSWVRGAHAPCADAVSSAVEADRASRTTAAHEYHEEEAYLAYECGTSDERAEVHARAASLIARALASKCGDDAAGVEVVFAGGSVALRALRPMCL